MSADVVPTATGNEPSPPPERIFRGWFVVASAFVLLAANSGFIFYGQAVYLDQLTEQGFATGTASVSQSIVFVVAGLFGQLVGRWLDRHDVRRIVLGGLVTSWISVLLLGRVTALWELYAVSVLLGLGFSAAGLVPITTVVTRWFETKRSVALAIASTGLSVGGLTFTQFVAWAVDDQGFRDAMPLVVGLWAAATLPVLPFLWSSPESRGRLASGAVAGAIAVGARFQEAVRSRFFRTFTLGYVLVLGMQVGGISQLVKLGNERADAGGALIAGLTIASVVARLIGGVVADSQPLMRLVLVFGTVQALALALLGQVHTQALLVACAVLFGATIGNLLMLQPLVVAEAMGTRDYARIFARNQLIVVAGVAGGPALLGSLRDASGYDLSYGVAGAVCLLGVVVISLGGSTDDARRDLWPDDVPEREPAPS